MAQEWVEDSIVEGLGKHVLGSNLGPSNHKM